MHGGIRAPNDLGGSTRCQVAEGGALGERLANHRREVTITGGNCIATSC